MRKGGGKEGATPCFEAGSSFRGGISGGSNLTPPVDFSGGTRSLIPSAVGKHHPRASHVTLAVISPTNAWTIWARSLIQLAGGGRVAETAAPALSPYRSPKQNCAA